MRPRRKDIPWICLWCCLLGVTTLLHAAAAAPLRFDVTDVGTPGAEVPSIQPWRVVDLEPDYGGLWVVAGDVDGDGEVEIVSAENVNQGDVHYTSTAVAQKLDGTVLWRWGDPGVGRKTWHHDVACQIHDWDGDGRNEVVVATRGFLVELDGATGKERRRMRIPEQATDCLVFCNLSGGDHASDLLVKDRYHEILAYDYYGKLLWKATNPGGYRTAHQPRPMDLDGDGRDEVLAGYAMLNSDGSVRWVYQSEKVNLGAGHLDCGRVLRGGAKPEDFRIVLTCCGANAVVLVDGNGNVLWEVTGHHFESADVGRVFPDDPGLQVVVDIDHRPRGQGPIWVLDEDGRHLGTVTTDYSRHHALLDWDGDGADEILVANNRAVYDHRGRRVATFAMPGRPEGGYEGSLFVGDMTGDGIPDVTLTTPTRVYIYKNEMGWRLARPPRPGSGPNFTLY